MNTEDLPQDQEYENQIRNDNINLDFNASNDVEKNQQVYGEEFLGNSDAASINGGRSQANSIQSQPEPTKPVVPANSLDIRAAAHPGVCVTHFILKLGSLLCFFLISGHTVINFVFTILFTSFDFWTVKNITGRKLVLLKWQSQIDENGDESWVYESTDPKQTPNQIDSTFFWFIQFSISLIWFLISLYDLLTFSFFWLTLSLVCFLLNATNFVGFYKCRGGKLIQKNKKAGKQARKQTNKQGKKQARKQTYKQTNKQAKLQTKLLSYNIQLFNRVQQFIFQLDYTQNIKRRLKATWQQLV